MWGSGGGAWSLNSSVLCHAGLPWWGTVRCGWYGRPQSHYSWTCKYARVQSMGARVNLLIGITHYTAKFHQVSLWHLKKPSPSSGSPVWGSHHQCSPGASGRQLASAYHQLRPRHVQCCPCSWWVWHQDPVLRVCACFSLFMILPYSRGGLRWLEVLDRQIIVSALLPLFLLHLLPEYIKILPWIKNGTIIDNSDKSINCSRNMSGRRPLMK